MITNVITIAGKQAKVAYCYATEIAFHDYTNMNITEFIQKSSKEKTDYPKTIAFLILSGIVAHEQATGEKPEVTDSDIIYKASREEINTAVAVIIKMWSEWYHLPSGEPKEEEQEGEEQKN